MGSLDSATSGVATNASDNTAQETTLATIRSVSGDWDNASVSVVPKLSAYTSNSTFIAPAGCTSVKVQCWGGGGSAGTTDDDWSSSALRGQAGKGGGGGAYSLKLVSVSATGQTFNVTVAGAGGTSSFIGGGVNMSAGGGSTGQNDALSHFQGAGGTASGGDVNISGGGGTKMGMGGGGAPFGGAGGPIGCAGSFPGGGGGCNMYDSAGRAGAAGFIIVEW